MKKNIHPPYQQVLFIDSATDARCLCGSTLQPKTQEQHEGKNYPAYRTSISSASHPFFLGAKQFIDAEGRISRFEKRYQSTPTTPRQTARKSISRRRRG